jgi:hypothetical protein
MTQRELRALTLIRPWDQAILFGGKRIENRKWKPWEVVMGQFIALHAGLKYDNKAAVEMIKKRMYSPPSPSVSPMGIVGVARITGYIEHSDDPWFSGPFGWTLTDVIPFKSPIKATGKQGLWIVGGETLEKVREAYQASLRPMGLT